MTEKFCGADVHRDLLVATILSGETKETRHFVNDSDDIDKLREWLKARECKRAVMESTSVYWVPLYLAMQGCVRWSCAFGGDGFGFEKCWVLG